MDEVKQMDDHAKGIARISQLIGDNPLIYPDIPLPAMAETVCKLLEQSLNSFTSRDAELAERIALEDDAVDSFYN